MMPRQGVIYRARFDFDSLLSHVARRWPHHVYNGSGDPASPRLGNVAKLCGYPRTYGSLWARDGMSLPTIERCADRLGRHPNEIWPDYHDKIHPELKEMVA